MNRRSFIKAIAAIAVAPAAIAKAFAPKPPAQAIGIDPAAPCSWRNQWVTYEPDDGALLRAFQRMHRKIHIEFYEGMETCMWSCPTDYDCRMIKQAIRRRLAGDVGYFYKRNPYSVSRYMLEAA